jgi:hypothetical protein
MLAHWQLLQVLISVGCYFGRVLAQLFPMRVRLQPPVDAAASARHAQQLQADAVRATTEQNYRAVSALASSRK